MAQGSGGAALASGADIAQGLECQFSGSLDEISYGWVRLQPLAYQDDINRLTLNVNSTRAGSQKLFCLMNQKGLKCHSTKTVCISIGTTKYREGVKKEIQEEPIMFGDFQMKLVEEEFYLGDVISAQGLEASVERTIEKRMSKIKGAIMKLNQ